ncbi:MAG: nicotinate (nicotinamide) nucleotide adenylyltransferase [Spirochaetales bacterium]|jgi:nicotinate-nucleotide adenylyltransferase|nr:nicotinate (nicotinamide) nucleotide adenylyltransferase [Spirochaetales bacterium]
MMTDIKGKIAIFGGSFNPVHRGHIHVAESAAHTLGYNKVIFIPSCVSAHKKTDYYTSPEHRLKMLHLAIEGNDTLLLDDCEIVRGGTSFTIDTIEGLSDRYRYTSKPGLIIGADLLRGFPSWRRVDDLVEQVDLIVARRTSSMGLHFPYPHLNVKNDLVDAASSEIRRRVREKIDICELVPKLVADYISRNFLYQSAGKVT